MHCAAIVQIWCATLNNALKLYCIWNTMQLISSSWLLSDTAVRVPGSLEDCQHVSHSPVALFSPSFLSPAVWKSGENEGLSGNPFYYPFCCYITHWRLKVSPCRPRFSILQSDETLAGAINTLTVIMLQLCDINFHTCCLWLDLTLCQTISCTRSMECFAWMGERDKPHTSAISVKCFLYGTTSVVRCGGRGRLSCIACCYCHHIRLLSSNSETTLEGHQ